MGTKDEPSVLTTMAGAPIAGNIAAAMAHVPQFIVERQLALCDKVDSAYGAGVRKAIGEKR